MKITEMLNQLNDLKIAANKWLDDNYPNDKREQIEERKEKIDLLRDMADICNEPFETEEDLVRNICQYCSDRNKTPEETILEVALYALAWDELLNTPQNQ